MYVIATASRGEMFKPS